MPLHPPCPLIPLPVVPCPLGPLSLVHCPLAPTRAILILGIEIDSQILNALFCVTGLGLLPWRLRDLYLLHRKNYDKLAVIHQGWYIHGVTKLALLYWVVWLFIMNSVWQIVVPPSSHGPLCPPRSMSSSPQHPGFYLSMILSRVQNSL